MRSVRALERLNGPTDGLRLRVAIQQLRYDWDLLTDEATSNDDALRLQLRVLDLGSSWPEADRLLRPRFEWAPLGRLFSAIIAQASQNGAGKVDLAFESEAVLVAFDGREVMMIPPDLSEALRGMVRFIERAGYDCVRPWLPEKARVPEAVSIGWVGPDRLALTLA